MKENNQQSDIARKEERTVKIAGISIVVIIIATFIGSMFTKPLISNNNNEIYEDILSIMASNGVLENENSSMLIAYSDWSYLEMLHSVYDMSTCTYRISEGDTEGEYIVNYTGKGRDNPFSGYIGNYRMSIVVDLNDSHCYYSYDGNTYVSYIIMSQN